MNYSKVNNKVVKLLNNKYNNTPEISIEEWIDYEQCDCGGPIFKYHDTTSNVYVVKCGHVKETLDIKTRIWNKSKKQPCNFINIYRSDQPKYDNLIIPIREKYPEYDPHKSLFNNLEFLFNFYFLAKKDITIQEINSLVKFKLGRKIRMVYYLVTAGPILLESHREPMEDYQKRIFSIPIIDRTIKKSTTKNTTTKNKCHFIETELLSDDTLDTNSECSDNSDSLSYTSDTSETTSETEVEQECKIGEDILDDLDNLELYDEPEEPEEYEDYY